MKEGAKMGFLDHLDEFRKRILRILAVIMLLFVIFILVEADTTQVLGLPVVYPTVNVFHPIAIQFFGKMEADLVPEGVETAVMGPTDAILVEFKIALFLSILFAMPVIVHQMGRFLAPALRRREKRLLLQISVPSALLFITGAVFAYMFVLPFVYDFLYSIAFNLVDNTYLNPSEFVDFTLLFLFSFGLAFELPIIMSGITFLGVVDARFWRRNWRYSAVAIFIFGAVITPDGSGITMMMVSLPMLALYALGYSLSVRMEKGGGKNGSGQ
ncbi:MAG: twin-arginine translocase subunit TatC [Thermoplasmata archaeon]